MNIPPISNIELALLKVLDEAGGELPFGEAVAKVKEKYPNLSDEDKSSTLASGGNRLNNRIAWTRQILVEKGEIDGSTYGIWRITSMGKERLQNEWEGWKPEYRELRERVSYNNRTNIRRSHAIETEITSNTIPEEELDNVIEDMIRRITEQILNKLKNIDASTFEIVVGQVLEKLGYGSLDNGTVKITGRSGDGGIDGFCSMDKLGLIKILFQAKKWENNIPPNAIRDFIGAVHNKRANYGVFITTSNFSTQAVDEAKQSGNIKLINGEELASIMISTSLGVKTNLLPYYKIDEEYFAGLS